MEFEGGVLDLQPDGVKERNCGLEITRLDTMHSLTKPVCTVRLQKSQMKETVSGRL